MATKMSSEVSQEEAVATEKKKETTASPALNLPKVKYNWVSITDEFFAAVKCLQLGELVHDELFGLFEAMSAIEMMDPKMDTGLLCNREKRKTKSFDYAVEKGLLKLDNLTIEELTAIMDTTLACIVSWLEGHSLAQTVFTNMYLHKPYNIQDKTLRVFSIAIYKLLEIIRDFIQKASVYEEEDFQPMLYGFHLSPDVSEQRIVSMLREVEEFHKKTGNIQTGATVDEPVESLAIYSRIKFVRVFYQMLTMLFQRKEDQSQTPTECLRLLTISLDMLIIMQKTVHIGTAAGEQWHENIMGFEPLINQRLLPPTFPKYTRVKKRSDALGYIEEINERLKVVCKIYSITSYHQALDFFIEFSKTRPCLLSRSILQYIYVGTHCLNPPSSSIGIKDLLRDAAKLFVSPPVDVTRTIMSNPQAKSLLDTLLSHCTKPLTNLLQVCGHNRARQRDKFCSLLEDFIALQDEAERVDLFIHNICPKTLTRQSVTCYATWVLYHTLRIMIMFLMSGFELELYSIHEYCYIYWYMYEFLFSWLVSALTRADGMHMEQELQEMQKAKGSKKSKSKNKKKPRPFSKEILYNQALQNMCGGYFKAILGFRVDDKIDVPREDFGSEKIRYEHRFMSFQRLVTPPPMQYSEFNDILVASTMETLSCLQLYYAASQHFQQARQLLENVVPFTNELADLIVVCKTNCVVLKLLADGHKRDSPHAPEYDFLKSNYFPIFKLP